MNWDYRELIRWAFLFFFVLLVTYIVDAILGPVLLWLTQVLQQVVSAGGSPEAAEQVAWAFALFGETAVHFAAGGFAYTWIIHVPWHRGAVMSCLCFLAIRYGGAALAALGSPWFYTDAVMGLAAASAGAFYFERHRHNEHLVEIRRRLHQRFELA